MIYHITYINHKANWTRPKQGAKKRYLVSVGQMSTKNHENLIGLLTEFAAKVTNSDSHVISLHQFITDNWSLENLEFSLDYWKFIKSSNFL